PRAPAMQLGAQRLDLGLAARDLVGERLAPRLEALVLGAEIEPGLAQLGERVIDLAALALELLDALDVLLGLDHDAVVAPTGLLAATPERLELRVGGGDVGAARGELRPRFVELTLRVRDLLAGLAGRRFARRDLAGLTLDVGDQRFELG